MPKTKTATERDALIKQVRPYARTTLQKFERAVEDLAFKGSMNPDHWEAIEDQYKRMRQRMINLLAKIPGDA